MYTTILLTGLNVCACMRACVFDFLKDFFNIYDSFMYKNFIRKIL